MNKNIEDIQRRLKNLKDEVTPVESSVEKDKAGKNDLGRAYELIATPIVAGGIGVGLDHLFSTSPLFFITLAILGVFAGFWGIYKSSQNIATPLDSKRLQDAQKQAKTRANFEQNSPD